MFPSRPRVGLAMQWSAMEGKRPRFSRCDDVRSARGLLRQTNGRLGPRNPHSHRNRSAPDRTSGAGLCSFFERNDVTITRNFSVSAAVGALRFGRPGCRASQGLTLPAARPSPGGWFPKPSRPLWELFLIEGFGGSGWVAILRVHHAGIDGQSGQVLAEALMDVSPQPRTVTPPRVKRSGGLGGRNLGVGELLALGLKNVVIQAVQLVRGAPKIVRSLSGTGQVMRAALPRIPGLSAKDEDGKTRAGVPRTRFNTSVTNQRAWAGRSIPLADVKRVAKASGSTVNDVILTICGAAMRKYMLAGNELPERSLVALMPVSTREAGDKDMSNKVSVAPIRLHTDDADILQQLREIHADTSSVKDVMGRNRGGIPSDLPIIGMPWLMSSMISLMGRLKLANVLPLMGNLVITNVMTSPVPLYLCGARLVTYLPVLILMHGQALGIAIHSYAGSVDFGVVGCRRAMPDVEEIAQLIVDSLAELDRALAAPRVAAAPATVGPAVVQLVPSAAKKPARTRAAVTRSHKPARARQGHGVAG